MVLEECRRVRLPRPPPSAQDTTQHDCSANANKTCGSSIQGQWRSRDSTASSLHNMRYCLTAGVNMKCPMQTPSTAQITTPKALKIAQCWRLASELDLDWVGQALHGSRLRLEWTGRELEDNFRRYGESSAHLGTPPGMGGYMLHRQEK